jgi:hypothetical protein
MVPSRTEFDIDSQRFNRTRKEPPERDI